MKADTDDSVRIAPPSGWRLERGEVHVWRAFLDEEASDAPRLEQKVLSDDERERARRICRERDRLRFVAARGVLRILLGRYLGTEGGRLRFQYGPFGKPGLSEAGGEAPIYFNVTHSDDLAFFAITGEGEVGVDAEHVREIPEWEWIAAACFAPEDEARLHGLAGEDRMGDFFRAWTRREALLKASGRGWSGSGGAESQSRPAPDWTVRDFAPGPSGCAAALAVASREHWGVKLRSFRSIPNAQAPAARAC